MAKLLALSLSLCFLLFGCSLALREQQPQLQNECQLERLTALEPDNRIESEAGIIETWNPNNKQFRCAGVALSRCTLQRNALRRPFYSNAPQEIFIQQGSGFFGMIFPGCPDTFEEPQESEQGQGRRFRDSHQKVHRFREGDIIAVPTGVVFWMFNDQENEVIAVSLLDSSSLSNQLDQMPRRFYLAGNQEQEFLQYQQHQQRERQQQGRHQQGIRQQGRRGEQEQEQENEGGNIFSGFNKEFLQDVLNVDRQIVDRLQGNNEDEERGAIVRVRGGLSVISPPRQPRGQRQEEERQPRHHGRGRQEEEEEERQQPRGQRQEEEEEDERQPRHHGRGSRSEEEEVEEEQYSRHRSSSSRGSGDRRERGNGIAETICTGRLRHNIGRSSSPDIYNPRAGRITTVNSLDFPMLRWLKLSAEHGSLHRNAMFVPHYNVNANSILYALRGRAWIQVVNCTGNTVFDGEVEAGRVLIVPQNFAVAGKSLSDRFSYVSFKTDDRATINRLVGRSSALSGLPEEVIASTFNLERNQARQLKDNMQQFQFLVPPRESQNIAAA